MGEINKYVAGFCSTLLVLLGLNFFGEQLFHPYHGEKEELAFALEIDDAGGEEEEVVTYDVPALVAAADVAAGEKLFKRCAGCHSLEEGVKKAGPSLYGIVNKQIAAADFGYSGNLPADETWTGTNLFGFIGNPADWSREKTGGKTSMSFKGYKDAEDRAALIAYLNQTDGSPDPIE